MLSRVLAAGLVWLLHTGPAAQSPAAARPLQADGIVRLLADLEDALQSGRQEDLAPLISGSLPAVDAARLRASASGGTVTSATIRERARRPIGDGYDVLAEVLVGRGRRGRITTWQLGVRPRAGAPDRFELASLAELASIGDLLKLELEATKQFAVHNLRLTAPDFTLEVASGVAFAAESDTGITALAIRGRGTVHFSPASAAEQGQLRLFAGKPVLAVDVDELFVRLNAAEFADRQSDQSLRPTPVRAEDLARAREIFTSMSTRTYNLDLRDLTSDRWSLEPPFGSLVVEFRTRRFGWLTYVRSPNEAEDVTLFDRARRRNISVYTSLERAVARGTSYSEDDNASYDAEHYAVDLRLDPARAWIAGRTSVRIRSRQTLSSLTLKLAEPLALVSVQSPSLGHLLTLRVVGQNSVIVTLPQALLPDRTLTIDIEFNGRVEPQGLNREAIGVAPDPGQRDSASELLLLPEPRFMYSNSVFWYPQSATADYATATMRLTVPSEYQIIGSGTFGGASIAPVQDGVSGRGETRYVRTVQYTADRPVRYLSCIISRFVPVGRLRASVPAIAPPQGDAPASASSEVADSGGPAVNLEVVATPRQAGRSRQLPARVADIVRFYATRIGEAPYPDFTLAALDDNLPGGHSPPFFALLHQPLPTTPYSWSNDPVSFENYPSFFLAHEIAHQWWGHAVGWKNYHEQWLSEGLSQYFALLYAESDRGPELVRSVLSQMRTSAMNQVDEGPISLGYRLGHVRDDSRVFRAVVYNKSAIVLHMLRRLMGDEAFFAAMRRFYATWRFKKAGTDDFRRVFEASAPKTLDLGRFIDRWIRGTTLPRVQVDLQRVTDGMATVRVEQVGDVFDVPITIAVQTQDGRTELFPVALSRVSETFELPVKGLVRRVEGRDLALGVFVK